MDVVKAIVTRKTLKTEMKEICYILHLLFTVTKLFNTKQKEEEKHKIQDFSFKC